MALVILLSLMGGKSSNSSGFPRVVLSSCSNNLIRDWDYPAKPQRWSPGPGSRTEKLQDLDPTAGPAGSIAHLEPCLGHQIYWPWGREQRDDTVAQPSGSGADFLNLVYAKQPNKF